MNNRPMYHPKRVDNFMAGDAIVFWALLSVAGVFVTIGAAIYGAYPLLLALIFPLSFFHYLYRACHHEAAVLDGNDTKLKIYDIHKSLSSESQSKIPITPDTISNLSPDEDYEVYSALLDLQEAEKKKVNLEAKMAARGKELTRTIREATEDVDVQNQSYREVIEEMKELV